MNMLMLLLAYVIFPHVTICRWLAKSTDVHRSIAELRPIIVAFYLIWPVALVLMLSEWELERKCRT